LVFKWIVALEFFYNPFSRDKIRRRRLPQLMPRNDKCGNLPTPSLRAKRGNLNDVQLSSNKERSDAAV